MLIAGSALTPLDAAAQDKPDKPKAKKSDSTGTSEKKKKDSTATPPLFKSDSLIAVTFTTNWRQIRGDKEDKAPYRAATISYLAADGKQVTVPIRAKTHGIWRLKNCEFPPIRLNIGKEAKGTLFEAAKKPKMVSVCKDRDNYEQHVLQEMQLYRIYQLLTPVSHRVRPWRVKYADSASGREVGAHYGFVFEDPDELAQRYNGKMITTKGAGPDDMEPGQAAIVYLFQYLIANTDFSFNGLHNGELIMKADGSPLLPVAYDFDFAGAVNAPYATVDPRLSVKRVRDRLFRGYCNFKEEYQAAVALFKEKKPAIYALYQDDVGKLLDPRVVKETLEYFDEFYATLDDKRDFDRRILGACLGAR